MNERDFAPQTNTNVELTNPGFLVDTAWIAGYIQTRNTHFACDPCDRHRIVEGCSWSLSCSRTVTMCLKADTVNCRIHLGFAEDLCDHIRQWCISPQVNRFTAETARLLKTFRDQISYDDYSSTQQLRRYGICQPDRSSACNVHRRSRRDPAVKAPW